MLWGKIGRGEEVSGLWESEVCCAAEPGSLLPDEAAFHPWPGEASGGRGGGVHAEPRGPARRLCFLGSRTCSGLCPALLGAAGEQVSNGWSGFWCPPCRGDWCRVSSPQHRRAGRRCLQTRLSCDLCFSHDGHLGPRKPAVKSSLAWLSVFPTATPGCALEAAGPDDSL